VLEAIPLEEDLSDDEQRTRLELHYRLIDELA